MPRQETVAQVWRCPTCWARCTTPLLASAVFCSKDHGTKTRAMIVEWDTNRGGKPPPP